MLEEMKTDPSEKTVSLSIVILTLNEEQDLPACLRSLNDWGEVFILDSGSIDKTQSIAKERGIPFFTNKFKDFGDQRNFALRELPLRTEWVLFLDADERATSVFRRAVDNEIAKTSSEVAGFFCCWRMLLEGRWLRRCDAFPKWQLRLVRRGRAWFRAYGHGQKEGLIDGQLGYIKEPYDHHAFSKGWTEWFAKHGGYAMREAQERRMAPQMSWKTILLSEPSARNEGLKNRLGRSWLFPLIRFAYPFFVRGGFLEGVPGFHYCLNIAIYEYWILLKLRELRLLEAETKTAEEVGR